MPVGPLGGHGANLPPLLRTVLQGLLDSDSSSIVTFTLQSLHNRSCRSWAWRPPSRAQWACCTPRCGRCPSSRACSSGVSQRGCVLRGRGSSSTYGCAGGATVVELRLVRACAGGTSAFTCPASNAAATQPPECRRHVAAGRGGGGDAPHRRHAGARGRQVRRAGGS